MSIDLIIRNLDGYDVPFHFEGEIRAINRTADGVTGGVIVSIGSFRGQMDCALALHAHVPVFCIDPRQGWPGEARDFGDLDRPYWMRNILLMGLADKVRPIELPSLVAAAIWDKPISLLWIDGNHTEVDADLNAWLPHVVDGGLVALHDGNSPMIISAVASRDDLVEIERADLTVIYRKEGLYELYEYDGISMLVRRGPYNHDDRYVVEEVRSYDIGRDKPETILDIGGHIGAFTVWMKQLYPDVQIVTIEPEMSCYKLLARNTESLPGVTAMYSRAGYDPANVMLHVNPVNSGCHRVIPLGDVKPGQPVVLPPAAVTIESVMAEQKWERLSILKIDCEFCENDVLLNCSNETLRHIGRIVGERHISYDDFMATIGARLTSLGFDVSGTTNPLDHATFVAVNQNAPKPKVNDASQRVASPRKSTKRRN